MMKKIVVIAGALALLNGCGMIFQAVETSSQKRKDTAQARRLYKEYLKYRYNDKIKDAPQGFIFDLMELANLKKKLHLSGTNWDTSVIDLNIKELATRYITMQPGVFAIPNGSGLYSVNDGFGNFHGYRLTAKIVNTTTNKIYSVLLSAKVEGFFGQAYDPVMMNVGNIAFNHWICYGEGMAQAMAAREGNKGIAQYEGATVFSYEYYRNLNPNNAKSVKFIVVSVNSK